MALQTTNISNGYTGDGVLTQFAFTMTVYELAHIRCFLDGVETTDFSAALNNQEVTAGGVVTFNTAPGSGVAVLILRDVPYIQDTVYIEGDPFPAKVNEYTIDEVVMMIQQLADGGSGPGPGGDFLPLAGGEMDEGARISWPAQGSGTYAGEMGFFTFFGKEQFSWSPVDPVNGDIGFSWAAADGKILGYNTDGRHSLALVGRDSILFNDLLDEDVITKRDTADMNIDRLTWRHQTDETSFGVITAAYDSANLAGIAGGQALIFNTFTDAIYQGYKFVTENADGSKYEVDISGGGIWSDRQQDNGLNEPLLDQLVSRRWVENFGPGGVPEAPNDGQEYVRKDLDWVVNTGGSGVPEAPENGNTYGRKDADWVVIGAGGAVNWGEIGGTLSDQTDLQTALDAKANDNAVVKLTGNQNNISGIKTFVSGMVISGQVSSIALNCTAGGVAALGFNAQNQRIQQVATPSVDTDGVNRLFVTTRVPLWSKSIAAGAWTSVGGAQGTQRNCTVSRTGLGQYRINLTQPLSSALNAHVDWMAYGSLVGISAIYSAVSTTQINVSTVRTDNDALIDVGVSFSVTDRGLL